MQRNLCVFTLAVLAAMASMPRSAKAQPTPTYSAKVLLGQEANWVQIMPGKGWNTLLRLYAALEPWFDKTWKPGDFERVD